MYGTARVFTGNAYRYYGRMPENDNMLRCDWPSLKNQLLLQWHRLSRRELDTVGPDSRRIAALVECKYGISARLVENYLANLARTLPLMPGGNAN